MLAGDDDVAKDSADEVDAADRLRVGGDNDGVLDGARDDDVEELA